MKKLNSTTLVICIAAVVVSGIRYLYYTQLAEKAENPAVDTENAAAESVIYPTHSTFTIHGVEFESRYEGFIAEESFMTNFPYTPLVATNAVPRNLSDWKQQDFWMRNRHWFVTGFYSCPSRFTTAFQKLNEILRTEGVPWDPFAYGIIFNKLNEAAMIRRLNKRHPENERFQKLLHRAQLLENTIHLTLSNDEFWLDGSQVSRKKAIELQKLIQENLPYEQYFGDFHHFPLNASHHQISNAYTLVK